MSRTVATRRLPLVGGLLETYLAHTHRTDVAICLLPSWLSNFVYHCFGVNVSVFMLQPSATNIYFIEHIKGYIVSVVYSIQRENLPCRNARFGALHTDLFGSDRVQGALLAEEPLARLLVHQRF